MNPNDIILEQATNHGTFTEAYMSVVPNGIVVADADSHLKMVTSLPSNLTASYGFSSSYALTASYGNFYPDIIDTSGSNVTIFPTGNGVVINQTHTPNWGRIAVCIGVNTATPQYPLDVNGAINTNAGYLLNGLPYTASLAIYSTSSSLATTAQSLNFTPLVAVSASWVSSSNYTVNADTASYFITSSVTSASFSISSSHSDISDVALSINFIPEVVPQTGSIYFETSGAVNLLYVYNGTQWVSCSMS